mmetsp:Transcript_982/g.2297  ORF Transcript_982/g.2297 Transcript_982/m.2297 type:complete len:210 (+) Transcript_982:913-1542(+)
MGRPLIWAPFLGQRFDIPALPRAKFTALSTKCRSLAAELLHASRERPQHQRLAPVACARGCSMCCRGARLSVAAIAVAAGRVDGPLHTAHGSLCQLPRRLAGHRFLAALLGCCWSWVTCVGQACAWSDTIVAIWRGRRSGCCVWDGEVEGAIRFPGLRALQELRAIFAHRVCGSILRKSATVFQGMRTRRHAHQSQAFEKRAQQVQGLA